MLVVCRPIFVADKKLIHGYNFVALLIKIVFVNFLLKFSIANVNKSKGICGFTHIYHGIFKSYNTCRQENGERFVDTRFYKSKLFLCDEYLKLQ